MDGASNGRSSFAFSASVFIRLLAVVHVVAFASAWMQIQALIGPRGLSSATAYFAAAREQLGTSAYLELPSLCWIFGTGTFLDVLCAVGVTAGVLLFAGIAPAVSLLVLWASYLSLMNAGQMFFAFQWDGLLLETTLLAVWLVPWRWLPLWRTPSPAPLARLLVWWLLFRLMFLAGVVKLTSGDPTWRNLTALTFHYETQPLPTPLAWYAHQAPVAWHKLECLLMFVIELGLPFLVFTTRQLRHTAALVLAGFMAGIAATGNYTFFNFLAIILCLSCLDDAAWDTVWRTLTRSRPAKSSAVPSSTPPPEPPTAAAAAPYPLQPAGRGVRRGVRDRALAAFAGFTFLYTGVLVVLTLGSALGPPPGFATLARYVDPFRSFNTYGLFAVMTHPRTELVIEGSNDGVTWRDYEFPAKPGDVHRRPTFVAPYQPRLDWQLWFATLQSADENPWVTTLAARLMQGSPAVLKLIGRNPFPDRPPRFVRVLRYEYRFTTPDERARTGAWWHRELLGTYLPAVTL